MLLLGLYIFIAIFFSFLCSISEAVLLSITRVHIARMEQEGHPAGQILYQLKEDVNRPLAAILILNTVAHTAGAAGAGAQAINVFGSASLGVVSAILTVLILVFSEIIPKTLGATYWKALAPLTAYMLKGLVWALYPLIIIAQFITRHMTDKEQQTAFSRSEFALMSQLSVDEGHIDSEEAAILQNLFLLQEIKVKDVMTPGTVMFSVSQALTVEEFFHKHKKVRFTRIPVYEGDPDNIVGVIIRTDLILAKARDNNDTHLSAYVRKMPALLDDMTLSHAMKEIIPGNHHIALIVNEYGTVRGILTLEDILETLLGREIIDETDKHTDMRKEARRLWKARAKRFNIEPNHSKGD